MNAWVDVARAEIIEKYQPGENDKTAGVLQAAHVREGDYFSSRVHHDIDAIMEDVREAHRCAAKRKEKIESDKLEFTEVGNVNTLFQWIIKLSIEIQSFFNNQIWKIGLSCNGRS